MHPVIVPKVHCLREGFFVFQVKFILCFHLDGFGIVCGSVRDLCVCKNKLVFLSFALMGKRERNVEHSEEKKQRNVKGRLTMITLCVVCF